MAANSKRRVVVRDLEVAEAGRRHLAHSIRGGLTTDSTGPIEVRRLGRITAGVTEEQTNQE